MNKLTKIRDHFIDRSTDQPSLIFIRGYYLDSMGKPGTDDANIYDDAAFLLMPNGTSESWNANTGPSLSGKNKFKMNLGLYSYYRGMHKGRIKALRPYPEGVTLKGTRDGKPSTGSHTNIHDGGTNPNAFDVVWSEGCLTIPNTQYKDYQSRLWAAMDASNIRTDGKTKIINVILVENKIVDGKQRIVDGKGTVIV